MRAVSIVLCLIGLFGLATNAAVAELQNVIVNGFYGSMKDENRFVRQQLLTGNVLSENPPYFRIAPGGAQLFRTIQVPEKPSPAAYSHLGRVCLSFYVGVPRWREDNAGRVEVRILVDGYEAFKREFTEPGWHACFADLSPWAGEYVDFRFDSGFLEGLRSGVLIAFPRLLAWHGPHDDGGGGIRGRSGIHGAPILSGIAPEEVWEPIGDRGNSVGTDCSIWRNGGLVMVRIDVLEPSSVVTKSEGHTRVTKLPSGFHWMPIPLPAANKPKCDLRTVEGRVERGPVDVIPNFMATDAGWLYCIWKRDCYRQIAGRL